MLPGHEVLELLDLVDLVERQPKYPGLLLVNECHEGGLLLIERGP
jgi:hypothetical protein